ncbi:PREDICTED: uncharacterized protein LOC100635519 [Amphimedon queenslandica]|uniref:PH domain-containing protein n=1 Tax=Amphimedon queenslandica TaxID=400682 RepID=A0A1X7V8D7_AMPQE|nr:PREDICTED: uncharacterized protein LOC100635519 [Amphimedon queenslandica]|eukprot:XP_003385233.1 PREDICTED: uncharacterized protein LOC100635519 [Amphimedon queenslandica]
MSSPAPRRRKFAFDLRKPIMKGVILKQGGFHKAFKQRFFILYPGFLVYYEDGQKWQYDLQRGETLGSRLGAIKLVGGSVEKSRNPPKGAKYAFVVHCPDKSNNRSEFTFNCQSNEERYQWISKIQSAIPTGSESPQAQAKKVKAEPDTLPVSKLAEPPTPNSMERQETVDDAALLATKNHTEDDHKETHIDDVLGPSNVQQHSSDEEDPDTIPLSDNPANKAKDNDNEDKTKVGQIVSSASIKVRESKEEVEEEKESNTVTSEETVAEQTTEGEPDDMEVKEVVIETEAAAIEKFRASIIDHSLIGDPDQDSASDGESGPRDGEGSNTSSPPPEDEQIVIEASNTNSPPPEDEQRVTSPSIVVTEGTLKREGTGASGGSSSPERSTTPDMRRPSGALVFTEKRGYLYKVGGNVKSWNLRYFILQPGIFRYFKNDPQGKPLGEVKLKNVKITFPKKGEKKFSAFQFNVHTESTWNKRRDWGMAASTEKEMKEWMEAFELASGAVITSPDSNGSE